MASHKHAIVNEETSNILDEFLYFDRIINFKRAKALPSLASLLATAKATTRPICAPQLQEEQPCAAMELILYLLTQSVCSTWVRAQR